MHASVGSVPVPRSLTLYLAHPWTAPSVTSAILGMGWSAGTHSPVMDRFGGRAWVRETEEDDATFCARVAAFKPSVVVLFEPSVTVEAGRRPMATTLLDLAEKSDAAVFLYQSEEVLLVRRNGGFTVSGEAWKWWMREGVADLLQARLYEEPKATAFAEPKFKQFAAVRLIVARPDLGLAAGAQGVVVDVYTKPHLGYHVEFLDSAGHTLAVGIMYPNELAPA